MDELVEGTRSVLNGERDVAENKIFAHPLPFNVIPHIDKFQENGYTKEEMKVTWETRKICGLADDFPIRLVLTTCCLLGLICSDQCALPFSHRINMSTVALQFVSLHLAPIRSLLLHYLKNQLTLRLLAKHLKRRPESKLGMTQKSW